MCTGRSSWISFWCAWLNCSCVNEYVLWFTQILQQKLCIIKHSQKYLLVTCRPIFGLWQRRSITSLIMITCCIDYDHLSSLGAHIASTASHEPTVSDISLTRTCGATGDSADWFDGIGMYERQSPPHSDCKSFFVSGINCASKNRMAGRWNSKDKAKADFFSSASYLSFHQCSSSPELIFLHFHLKIILLFLLLWLILLLFCFFSYSLFYPHHFFRLIILQTSALHELLYSPSVPQTWN